MSNLPLLECLEVELPPEQPHMEPVPLPYFVNKELPPIPQIAPETALAAPPIPPYNPLRFTRGRPNRVPIGDTAISPRPDSMSSEESLSRVPSLLRTRHAKTPKTLRLLGQPTLAISTPTYGETNKVQQLTGYNITSPADHRKSMDSISTSSSFYSDQEIDLLSDRDINNIPGGYIGLQHSANIVQRHSASPPGTQKRVSKRHNKASLDDLLQRQFARFQHDTHSPTTSIVHSPNYSTAQSLYSNPPTPPLHDAPHAGGFSLPLRIRPVAGNDMPESRFSDSTPPASPTLRFVASIRDSVLSLNAHAPLGRARPISKMWDNQGDKNAEDDFFGGDRSSESGEDAWMSGGLQRFMRKKRDAMIGEAGIEGGGMRSRGDGLMRRISDAVRTRRSTIRIPRSDGSRGSGSGLGIVIPDHRRKIGGPDTPMPAVGSGKGWVESVLSKEAAMSRRKSVRGAIGRAAESRWVVGGEERREKRRERLKDQIRVIGIQEE
ncbi:hypothetical protein V490_03641 [Pseudogymnoascus sp. VKM F-3557]|nr:hypothetical protein V490_03641 [Pseudogymnoascus sp. VKM F-3557]